MKNQSGGPVFQYGPNGRAAMGEEYQETIARAAKPGPQADARRARAHGQLAYYAMWRAAVDFPASAWLANPQIAALAEQALGLISPKARPSCLAEALDCCVAGDKASQATWLLGLGAPRSPSEGMRGVDGCNYKPEAIGKNNWPLGAQGASWCALAASQGAWECLYAFEAQGVGQVEREGFFKEGLAARIGRPAVAKEAFATSHPWVAIRAEMGRQDSGREESARRLAAAWEPKDPHDMEVAMSALALRARFRENPVAVDYLAAQGHPLKDADWISEAMRMAAEGYNADIAWFEAVARWSFSSGGATLADGEAIVERHLFEAIEDGAASEAEDAAQALLASASLRASGAHGWGPRADGAGSALSERLAVALSGSDGEEFDSGSSARAAIDALMSVLEKADPAGGPKRKGPPRV